MFWKRKAIWIVLGIIILLALSILRNMRDHERLKKAQENDPTEVARFFVYNLGEKNIQLAKDLVIPEQRERIDKWLEKSSLEKFDCCNPLTNFPSDTCSGGGGFYFEDDFTDTRLETNYLYACSGGGPSLNIDKIIVEHIEGKWVITDWSEICVQQGYYSEEICYP